MATDQVARRIYFTDSRRRTIETVTYEGGDRRIVFSRRISILTDIAVYKDYLYVTASLEREIYFFSKTNGKQLYKIPKTEGIIFTGVAVFRPDAHPTYVKAHCVNYGCQQICVTDKNGSTCLCKYGYTLNRDMKTCSLSNENFNRGVMYSNESNFCIMDIRSMADFVFFYPKCVLNPSGTKYMALDIDQRKIIFANNTAIYWAKVDDLKVHQLTKPSGIISGMAWDGTGRNLYWTEENTGFIWRVSAESENENVFLEGLNKPRDIMILPHERHVYWISDRNGSTIETSNINGNNHQIILNSNHLVDPRSLSYDPYKKRIYFIDNAPDDEVIVNSCNLDGSDLKTILTLYGEYKSLEIYKCHALMTAQHGQKTKIYSASIEARLYTTSAFFSGNIEAIKVFDETIRQNETGPCFSFNGGCEQICISNGKSMTCECTFGFQLAENGKTCITAPSGSRDLFPYKCAVDYSTGNFYCIVGNGNKLSFKNERYISVVSPEGKHRVLVKELAVPYGIVVYPSKGLMFYTNQGLKPFIGRANMDGSQSAVLLNISSRTSPSELTIDYKTDCLYWISWPYRTIESCNIDGENHKTLIEYPDFRLLSLAFYQDYLFLSTYDSTSMMKVQISDPNKTIKFAAHAELGTIETISVYSSAVQNKNALCSVDNGGCSTFCFPVPDGRKCGVKMV